MSNSLQQKLDDLQPLNARLPLQRLTHVNKLLILFGACFLLLASEHAANAQVIYHPRRYCTSSRAVWPGACYGYPYAYYPYGFVCGFGGPTITAAGVVPATIGGAEGLAPSPFPSVTEPNGEGLQHPRMQYAGVVDLNNPETLTLADRQRR